MPNQSVQDFDNLPVRIRPADLLYLVRDNGDGTYSDYKGQAQVLLRTEVTYAQALEIISLASLGLVPGTVYEITDAVTNGTISLIASSTTTFFKTGTWALETQLKAFGSIELLTGTTGSVNTITVDGVNILPAAVGFNTNLATTCSDVAAAINAAGGDYTAYAINKVLVIQADATGTDANGFAVSGSSSLGLVLGNINNMGNGVETTRRYLTVEYDLDENQIYAAYDALDNISYRMSKAVIDALGYNPILNFRWGDKSLTSFLGTTSAWLTALITDTDFTNCFAIETEFASQFFGGTFSNNFHVNSGFAFSQFRYFLAAGFSSNDCTLNKGNFTDCIFTSANFSDVDMSACQLVKVEYFAGLVLANINLEGSIIQKDNFQLSMALVNSINGTANRGLVNSPITMGVIPDNFFVDRAVFTQTGLANGPGPGAELKAGIQTDADDCMLPQTAIAAITPIVITQDPQQSTAIRNIIVTPVVNTLTAGNFKLFVSGKIGL